MRPCHAPSALHRLALRTLCSGIALLAIGLPASADFRPLPGKDARVHIEALAAGGSIGGNGSVRASAAASLPRTGIVKAIVYSLTICGQKPVKGDREITADDLRSVVTEGWESMRGAFGYCSFNKLRIDPDNSVYMNLDLGCDQGEYPGNCDDLVPLVKKYEAKAKSIAAAQGLGGFRFSIHVVPNHPCDWAGGGWADAARFNGDYGMNLATVAHELGHCLELYHSRAIPKTVDQAVLDAYGGDVNSDLNLEYGDWSSAMGSQGGGITCFNLPQQRLLGWHSPATFDKSQLQPGWWQSLTMPDTMADPKAGVRINPNWLAPHPGKFIYVSWIPALGSNLAMHPNFQDRVYVHLHADTWESNSEMVARLKPGERWTSGELGEGWSDDLVVHFHYNGGPVSSKLLAAVSICRVGGSQTCAIGDNPNTNIYDFEMGSALGSYSLERGKNWQLRIFPDQWSRYFRVASPEDCATACFHLPTCHYFRMVVSGAFQTDTGLTENCELAGSGALRGPILSDRAWVSGRVLRSGPAPIPKPSPPPPRPLPSPPPPRSLPRQTALVLALDAARMNAADLAAKVWRDDSGKGNHLTLHGVVRNTAFRGHLSFKGNANSYARRPKLAPKSITGTTWTGAVWYRDDGAGLTQGRSAGVLMQLNRWPTIGLVPGNFLNEMMWQTEVFWEYGSGGNVREYWPKSLPSIRAGCWQLLAVTKTATTISHYWNDKLVGSRPNMERITWGLENLVLGKDFRDNKQFLKGSIALALMYNQALNDVEIRTLFTRDRARFGRSLCQATA